MKYDKYGDPIIEKETTMNGKRRKAFAVTMVLQAIIIAINVAIMFIPRALTATSASSLHPFTYSFS